MKEQIGADVYARKFLDHFGIRAQMLKAVEALVVAFAKEQGGAE